MCNCLPCRKSSGTPKSFNLIVPASAFTVVSGTDKTWTRKGDSGQNVTYHNCANCCTLVYVEAAAMAGTVLVKLGVVDTDAALQDAHWDMEIYTKHRLAWSGEIAGAEQKAVA